MQVFIDSFMKEISDPIGILGIVSAVIVLLSMTFPTTTKRGSILMRSINIVGSCVFVVYGILRPAFSSAALNFVVIFINSYHLIKLIKSKK